MLRQLINIINDVIKPKFTDFENMFFSITEMIPTISEDIIRLYPNVVDNDGECVLISIDNSLALQVYHRLNTKSQTEQVAQYGSRNDKVTDSYNMSMFVIGNRRLLRKGVTELSEIIDNSLPSIFLKNTKQIAIFKFINTDYNSATIINTEFPNTDYSGMPDLFMIRYDYQIKHTYTKNCLDACETDCINYSSN